MKKRKDKNTIAKKEGDAVFICDHGDHEAQIRFYEEFYHCESCGKIYWKGSHYTKIKARIDTLVRGG